MPNQELKATTEATGTFRTIIPRANGIAASGNPGSTGGEILPAEKPDDRELKALTQQLNLSSRSIGRDLRFKVDLTNGSSVIQVLDRETGELIREIPPEKAQILRSGSGDIEIRLLDSRA